MEEFDEILIGEDFFSDEHSDDKSEEAVDETKETVDEKDTELEDLLSFEEESDEKDKKVEKESTEEKSTSNSLYQKLDKLGYLKDLQDEDGNPIDLESLSEEEEEELLEEVFEMKSQEKLNSLIQNLPPELRQLNEYVIKHGGNLKDFVSNLKADEVDYLKIDSLPDDKYKSFLKKELSDEGYDEDEIDIQLQALEEKGKLGSVAIKRFDKWKNKQKEIQNSNLEKSKIEAEKKRKEIQEFHTKVRSVLDSKNIGGLKLTSKVAKELDSYITKPVSDDSGRNAPQLNRDILKAFEDPNKLAVLAALAKEDFDITKLSKQFVTKGKEEITKKINRQNKIVPIRDLF